MPKEAFKTLILQKLWRYKVDFVHATSYLLKLQIDYVILDWHDQTCPGMPKEAFETYISQKLLEFQI